MIKSVKFNFSDKPGRDRAASDEPIKRFTIDVPLSLHTRVKTQCARRQVNMADVMRALLEREFPK